MFALGAYWAKTLEIAQVPGEEARVQGCCTRLGKGMVREDFVFLSCPLRLLDMEASPGLRALGSSSLSHGSHDLPEAQLWRSWKLVGNKHSHYSN